ncbi:hypothetical protein AMTRI_Chr08g164730 [Amborella trichopoda]
MHGWAFRDFQCQKGQGCPTMALPDSFLKATASKPSCYSRKHKMLGFLLFAKLLNDMKYLYAHYYFFFNCSKRKTRISHIVLILKIKSNITVLKLVLSFPLSLSIHSIMLGSSFFLISGLSFSGKELVLQIIPTPLSKHVKSKQNPSNRLINFHIKPGTQSFKTCTQHKKSWWSSCWNQMETKS